MKIYQILDNVLKEAANKQDGVDAVARQGTKEIIITAGVAGMREAVNMIRKALLNKAKP